jgi:hypothetical protein
MSNISSLRCALIGGLAAAISMLIFAAGAEAATFVVNHNGGAADPGINADCDTDPTADDDCTLRAAIEEANATPAADVITFQKSNDFGADVDDVAFVDGKAVSSVTISGTVPTITAGVTISAGDCADPLAPGDAATPCAIVPNFVVDSAGEVSLSGLAFGNATTAIDVVNVDGTGPAADFSLTNSWFGIDTFGDKLAAPATTDVLLEDVDGAQIGGQLIGQRNIFARQGTAVDILGADNTRLEGNTFGVLPDGSFARAGEGASNNGDNIEITGNSAPNPDNTADGTVIGRSSAFSASTAACDGSCNLILAAGQSATNIPQNRAGIDLNGEPGDGEIPADGTKVLGNQVGDFDFKLRNGKGLVVGDADNVQVGGPAAASADQNVFSANEITSGDSDGLLIQSNLLGLDGTGNNPRATTGIPELSLGGNGQVLDNHIISNSIFPAIQLGNTTGSGYDLKGNVIGEGLNGNAQFTGTPAVKLLATASGNTIGGTGAGEGNLISDLTTVDPNTVNTVGISIASDNNVVVGNRLGVGTNGDPRKLLAGIELVTDADDNTIGGNIAAAENLISNAQTDAIRITGAGSAGNEILRNLGSANGDLFIDLGNDGAGNLLAGPNAGAQAPVISTVTAGSLAGTAAPNAQVRVFTKSDNTPGEVEAFLAEAAADGSGNWQVSFPAETPGTILAATATMAANTSELSALATVPDLPPETTIDSGPTDTISDDTPTFAFSSTEVGSTFECKLDAATFAPCSGLGGSHTASALTDGAHTFAVRAIDPGLNPDPTPATRSFSVDTTAPETTITKKPKKKIKTKKKKAKVKVSFTAEASATFECQLDRADFKPCTSPFEVKAKSKGGKGKKHTISVQATDAAGNVETVPAAAKLKVIRKG